MSENQLVLILFVVVAASLGISYAREHLLPRRDRRRLVASITHALGFKSSPRTDEETLVAGHLDGCHVEISVSAAGNAIVTVPLSRGVLAADVAIYETSSWSYQKHEDRELGLTIDTGDAAFDRYFDVHGAEPEAALRVSESVRRVLVAHRRRGLMIVDGAVVLGSGSATPFGYVYQRPDTRDGVLEMVRAATALARDLER